MHYKRILLICLVSSVFTLIVRQPFVNAQTPDCTSDNVALIGGPDVGVTVVAFPDDFQGSVPLYALPGSSSKVVAELKDGDLLNVTDGPICRSKGEVWWKLSGLNGLTGWILQGSKVFAYDPQRVWDRINSLAFTTDGKDVLIGTTDERTREWNIQTGVKIDRIIGGQSVAVSNDGKYILTGGYSTVELWDRHSLKRIREFVGHQCDVNSVAFSPDNQKILTGSGCLDAPDSTVRLWDLNTGKQTLLFNFFDTHTDWVTSVAFTPDGKSALVVASMEGIKLWGTKTGQAIRSFGDHPVTFHTRAVLTSDGKQILITNDDTPTIGVWAIETGQQIRSYNVGLDFITALAISPDNTLALVGNEQGQLKLWNLMSDSEAQTFAIPAKEITNAIFSPDGKQILVGGTEDNGKNFVFNVAWLCDTSTGRIIQTFRAFKER